MFKFSSYIGNFEPKFPAVFFCRNKGDVVSDDSPEHIGRPTPTIRQVADLLGHSTTQVTEMYYVKKDMKMLDGVTNDFCL
jgi:integrase